MSGISVLMCVYHKDNPDYLDAALKSIWTEQILKPKEILLVEDGPLTPELNQTIEKWRKLIGSQLVIIKNEINLGLTKSLNKALDYASGEYYARMDSDDMSVPSRFKLQSEFLDKNPDIDIVGGAIEEINDEGQSLNVRRYPKCHEDVMKYIYKGSPLAHPAVMMRRGVFDDGNRYNENYMTSQDIALWFDLINKGYKIANLNEVILWFRRDNDVYKRRGRSKAKNELLIYTKGIRKLYGIFTLKYLFPLLRYIIRIMPTGVIKFAYNSKIRNKLLNR